MPGYGTGQSQQLVEAMISAMVPAAATATPPATALDSGKGTSPRFAREDHTHAARVQRTVMTTATDGTVTWVFARPIICAAGKVPPITYMVEDTGTPVVVQIISRAFTSDAQAGTDTHTAVTIKAQRSRTLPATLLSLASLINFDLFGAAAGATKVNLFAADPTQ
jgi:hypothetical protein